MHTTILACSISVVCIPFFHTHWGRPAPVCLGHTVRIDSSCAHVSTCGPHSKLCATKRGPPCKQGATSTTLHVFSFVAQQLSKKKTMVLKFEQLVQPICEFAHLPLEGTNAKKASHIGCISPRRQARKRRTLQTSKFWRLDCDGGDECESNLARSAALVRDAKP